MTVWYSALSKQASSDDHTTIVSAAAIYNYIKGYKPSNIQNTGTHACVLYI